MTSTVPRFGAPNEDQLSVAQREAAELISSGRRPRLATRGPFGALLHSPTLMTRLQQLGDYLRFDRTLEPDLSELTILTVARHWDQSFEWGLHHPLALQAGVPEDALFDVAANHRPRCGRAELAHIWDAVSELLRDGHLSDEVYARIEPLGVVAILDMIGTVGYYSTLAFTMNVARTPSPADWPPLPMRGS